MISTKLQQKILRLTKDLIHLPKGNNKHFTYLCIGNKIVSVGVNNYYKSHPLGKKIGYYLGARHSELDAWIRLIQKERTHKISLINVRINSLHKIGMSRPCSKCLPWVYSLGFKHLYYTNGNGIFVKEW